ncbi:hypothetical protein QVD17_12946 [Tagetes erecta]|uniref:Legume lectin domain-containing protein n=1 Tax=Tagetes erecta TaxID=13708 RepID=A0AAD8L1M0_TARER|nr:hypothetical protein QVD17_12946 [Tagetes erecta]
MHACILMSISLTIFLFLALIHYAASLTFNFTNITPNTSNNIILSGDANITNDDDGIQVTYKNINRSPEALAGRATYIRPLHLWDTNSTRLASFSTTFTFVIASYDENENIYGDGLTFFLAQNNSVINAAGSMGLPFSYQTNTSLSPFVAVEFDTYGTDEWDPFTIGDHVGININSLNSVAYRLWSSGISADENEFSALISYDSESKNLSVSFTSFINKSPVWDTGLVHTIDLRDVLPEWVIFGFSASTGDGYEKNNVKSWMFNSTEIKGDEYYYNGSAPTTNINQSNSSQPPTETINNNQSSIEPPTTESMDKSSSLSLTTTKDVGKVGLIVGSLVLVLLSHVCFI